MMCVAFCGEIQCSCGDTGHLTSAGSPGAQAAHCWGRVPGGTGALGLCDPLRALSSPVAKHSSNRLQPVRMVLPNPHPPLTAPSPPLSGFSADLRGGHGRDFGPALWLSLRGLVPPVTLQDGVKSVIIGFRQNWLQIQASVNKAVIQECNISFCHQVADGHTSGQWRWFFHQAWFPLCPGSLPASRWSPACQGSGSLLCSGVSQQAESSLQSLLGPLPCFQMPDPWEFQD